MNQPNQTFRLVGGLFGEYGLIWPYGGGDTVPGPQLLHAFQLIEGLVELPLDRRLAAQQPVELVAAREISMFLWLMEVRSRTDSRI